MISVEAELVRLIEVVIVIKMIKMVGLDYYRYKPTKMTLIQHVTQDTTSPADRLFDSLPPKVRRIVQGDVSEYFCGLRDSGGGQCLQEDSTFSCNNTWWEGDHCQQ